MERQRLSSERVRGWARELGFALCGVARARPHRDQQWYREWVARGYAGEMKYLSDHRAEVREDPRRLLAEAKTIICVGMLYNTEAPHTVTSDEYKGWISRYSWGDDYHAVMRRRLRELVARMEAEVGAFAYRVAVDTAPLLERSYAREAGLGWIGKNTCLINQQQGSWFFLGEVLTELELELDQPPPERCGTCRRCIDACPTQAIVPRGDAHWTIDSRLCISYLTIELKGSVPEASRGGMGRHLFGCDICQDVCPWNRRAPQDAEAAFAARSGLVAPDLLEMGQLTEEEFERRFGGSPVERARYQGFLRNVAIAMGNARLERYRPVLEQLAAGADEVVAESARWALARLDAGALP